MFKNYLRIALRFLIKNRTFSIINITGLTLGFLCFLLIALYLHDELSFDKFHKNADRIFRVVQHETQQDGAIRDIGPVALRIGPESVKQLPEVEDATTLFALGRITMGNEPAQRNYERTITTNPDFLTFFDFPLVEGDTYTALRQVDGVVLSEKLASRYFGKEPALGKRLWSILNRDGKPVEFVVSGVMKDFPKNSSLQLDLIFADSTWPTVFPWYTDYSNTDWTSNSSITYLKLKPGVDQKAFEEKLTALVKKNYPADRIFKSTFTLQSLEEVHLYSDNIQGNFYGSSNVNAIKPFYLYLFGSIAFLVLLIACLNYMNLSAAAAYKRTREIGTRKTLGAQKSQLIAQFSGEAVVLSSLSLALAIAFVQMLLPLVNDFTQKNMSLDRLPANWIMLLALIMVVAGVLSSLYPIFIITQVLPSEALRKDIKIGNRSLPVRKLLVAGQFGISIMMIASTLVIYQQLNFMRTKDLGFSAENQVVIDINSDRLRRNYENVKSEFSSIPEVQHISVSTRVPGEWKSFPIVTAKADAQPLGEEMIFVGIDDDFLETYKIKLLEGRNFISNSSDSTKVILTRLAVEQLGLSNPIGQVIEIPTVRFGGSSEDLEKPFRVQIVGVVEDFHFESLRQKMMPVIFGYPNTEIQRVDYYTLNIRSENLGETVEKLKAINIRIDPDNPLEYTFLNDRFEEFYAADEKRGQIFLTFSLVIVMISCLGLFAIVSYSIESRTKEIGVRKVLGASVQNLVGMVSKEFLGIVLLAGVIALPAAWYLMKNWLQDFAYQVPMSIGVFVAAALIALFIALITISFRALRAATANPVDSLRSE